MILLARRLAQLEINTDDDGFKDIFDEELRLANQNNTWYRRVDWVPPAAMNVG